MLEEVKPKLRVIEPESILLSREIKKKFLSRKNRYYAKFRHDPSSKAFVDEMFEGFCQDVDSVLIE